jgi:hypothetical protein
MPPAGVCGTGRDQSMGDVFHGMLARDADGVALAAGGGANDFDRLHPSQPPEAMATATALASSRWRIEKAYYVLARGIAAMGYRDGNRSRDDGERAPTICSDSLLAGFRFRTNVRELNSPDFDN